MTQSYFEEFGPPSLQHQELLILDTREKIQPLMKAAMTIPGLSWDETDIVQQVMQCIQYEHQELSQLHNKCLDLVARCVGAWGADYQATPHGWRRVGLNAYDDLERALSHQRDAWQVGAPAADTPWLNEVYQIANLLMELGTYLYTMLRSLGCYTRGYLYFQFKDWVGFDMMLVRFEPDLESLR